MAVVKKVSRQERAAATRRRMLDAAYELFCEQGFRATTMEAVAGRAKVAVQTLYFTFHTKDALLQEVLRWRVLGDDATPPPRQQWHLAAQAEPDVRRCVEVIVAGVAGILRAVAPLLPVFHSVAADPAGSFYRRSEDLRRDGYAELAADLLRKAPARRGITENRLTDLLFVLLGPETYRSFVIDCGWPPAEWSNWTTTTLLRDVFDLEPDAGH